MPLKTMFVLALVAVMAPIAFGQTLYYETVFPRMYSTTQQLQTPGNYSAFYLPMCGHERLQYSNMTFFITSNAPLDYVNWQNSPVNISVYLDADLTQLLVRNYDQFGVPASFQQQFSVAYPYQQRPNALYMVALTSLSGYSNSTNVTWWNFGVTFSLPTTRVIAGIVNTPPPSRPEPPAYVYVYGQRVPLQIAQQYVITPQSTVVSNPSQIAATSFRFVTSVCMVPTMPVVETIVQVMNLQSRVGWYMCYGNTSVVYGIGCVQRSSLGGYRTATMGGWSRIQLGLDATYTEEIHGVVEGWSQMQNTNTFSMMFRVGAAIGAFAQVKVDAPDGTSSSVAVGSDDSGYSY